MCDTNTTWLMPNVLLEKKVKKQKSKSGDKTIIYIIRLAEQMNVKGFSLLKDQPVGVWWCQDLNSQLYDQ